MAAGAAALVATALLGAEAAASAATRARAFIPSRAANVLAARAATSMAAGAAALVATGVLRATAAASAATRATAFITIGTAVFIEAFAARAAASMATGRAALVATGAETVWPRRLVAQAEVAMLSHVVLLTPKDDLSISDRAALVNALEQAVREIPSVRRVHVGRRVKHDAVYESQAAEAEYVVMLDFDDFEGFQAYLRHPAHVTLGQRFGQACRSAQVYDFEMHDQDELHDWLMREATAASPNSQREDPNS